MARFKVVVGTHVEEGRKYGKDEVVTSKKDLAKAFPGKFTEVHYDPAPAAHEDEDSAPAPVVTRPTTGPAATKPTTTPTAAKPAATKSTARK